MKNLYLIKKLVKKIEFDNITYDFESEFNYFRDKGQLIFIDDMADVNPQDYPIGEIWNVNNLILELQDLQADGCTHVQIDNDEDNYGYIIHGSNIQVATKEEREAFKLKTAENDAVNKKIFQLRQEIKRLQGDN